MPKEPQFGETWIDPISQVGGIVAGTTTTAVVLVGSWGNRVLIPHQSFALWQYKDPIPSYTKCGYIGCSRPAFLVYKRFSRGISEVVCPWHAPRGVKSSILSSPIPHVLIAGQICETCKHELTEVLGETPRNESGTSMWMCQVCGCWWIYTAKSLYEAMEPTSDQLPLASGVPRERLERFLTSTFRGRYKVLGITEREDSMSNRLNFLVRLKPSSATVLQGQSMLTLFDHLASDD